jgi:hypothetical protein
MYIYDNISLNSTLEWETFLTKVAEKFKTHILRSITFFQKSFRLSDNVKKPGTAGQGTDNIIQRMRFAYLWMY